MKTEKRGFFSFPTEKYKQTMRLAEGHQEHDGINTTMEPLIGSVPTLSTVPEAEGNHGKSCNAKPLGHFAQ